MHIIEKRFLEILTLEAQNQMRAIEKVSQESSELKQIVTTSSQYLLMVILIITLLRYVTRTTNTDKKHM